MTALLQEKLAVVATIDPDAYGTGAESTDYVSLENIRRVLFVLQWGTLASSGTLDFKLQQATSATGGGVKDITGKAITQVDASGNSDKQALVEVSAAELDLANGFAFVKGVMTFATAGGDAGVVALGGNARFLPASDLDLASVAEIVN